MTKQRIDGPSVLLAIRDGASKWEDLCRALGKGTRFTDSSQLEKTLNLLHGARLIVVEGLDGPVEKRAIRLSPDFRTIVGALDLSLSRHVHGAPPLERLQKLLSRFHLAAQVLLRRQRGRAPFTIADEYDMQDLLHALLTIEFNDVRDEEWTPSYAGGSSRIDFVLKAEKIVVECKKTRPGLGAKELGEQLLIDIGRYAAHPDCKTLVCFVYDPEGLVVNPAGLKADLETAGRNDLRVVFRIVPV